MDYSSSDLWLLAALMLFLITLPALAMLAQLRRIARSLRRIENMNLHSLQRWGG